MAYHNSPFVAVKINMIQYDDAIQRMLSIAKTVKIAVSYLGFEPRICIEGASYGNTFGQVELAEARAALAWAFIPYTNQIKIVPPKRIRADVLGNGNLKTKWKGLPHDTLAALNCAYWYMFSNASS